jgi:hypothetical protein
MFHLWFHARAWKINYNALHHFCASLGQIEWQNKQSVLTWGSNVLPNPQAWFRLRYLKLFLLPKSSKVVRYIQPSNFFTKKPITLRTCISYAHWFRVRDQ